jgi:hypothetical protein
MGPPAMGGMGLVALNTGLLVVLSAVWLHNYVRFQSTMILGLVGFSGLLLLENLVAVYFFFASMTTLYSSDPLVGRVVLVMRVLELLAVAFLTYATLK